MNQELKVRESVKAKVLIEEARRMLNSASATLLYFQSDEMRKELDAIIKSLGKHVDFLKN